jgi:hypothetical protein
LGVLQFKANSDKTVLRFHLNHELDVVVYACHPSYAGKHKQEGYDSDQSKHKVRTYLKNNQSKNS